MMAVLESSLSMVSHWRRVCTRDHSKSFLCVSWCDEFVATFSPALNSCVSFHFSTCFNRIDLPVYEEKDDLEEKLKVAITMAATGFEIE
jgi:hypothetical protein